MDQIYFEYGLRYTNFTFNILYLWGPFDVKDLMRNNKKIKFYFLFGLQNIERNEVRGDEKW